MPRIAEITKTADGRPCVVIEPIGDEGAISLYTPEEIRHMLDSERKAEREECAKIAEEYERPETIAREIRARKD